jgi:hypothetical protein
MNTMSNTNTPQTRGRPAAGWLLRSMGLLMGLMTLLLATGPVRAQFVGEAYRSPTMDLTGASFGNQIHLYWTVYHMVQGSARILRDDRQVAVTRGTSITLNIPDWNVHKYTVLSHRYLSHTDSPNRGSILIGPASQFLPVPRPVYPLPADVAPRTIRLRVDPIAGVTRYRFEVWNAANGRLVKRGDSSSGVYQLNLPANGSFRWRAAALSMNGSRVATIGTYTPLIPFTTRR